MFPAAFDYQRARSVDEALALLAKHGADARILAGGQSLIPAMRYRLARPAVLVDVNPISALSDIRDAANHRGSCDLRALAAVLLPKLEPGDPGYEGPQAPGLLTELVWAVQAADEISA